MRERKEFAIVLRRLCQRDRGHSIGRLSGRSWLGRRWEPHPSYARRPGEATCGEVDRITIEIQNCVRVNRLSLSIVRSENEIHKASVHSRRPPRVYNSWFD